MAREFEHDRIGWLHPFGPVAVDSIDVDESDAGQLLAWLTDSAGRSLVWAFDPRRPPGQMQRAAVVAD